MAKRSPGGHSDATRRDAIDRQVVALALPAFGALVAEPVFVLIDTAVVGTLGTTELAGLTLASTVLTSIVGLCVFLAYATTAAVARHIGAGQQATALRHGLDGMWLAAALGVVLAAALEVTAPWIATVLGAPAAVVEPAVDYLRWSAPGLPGMLLVLAATGVLRGVLDTRTPLVVAASGAVVNAVLSVTLVLGAGMGVAGSGLGTAVTQLAMAAVLGGVVLRKARREHLNLRPAIGGIRSAIGDGMPLLLRTASLRAAILLATWVATGLGTVALAGHQAVTALWALGAFALDAFAIAAQALVGQSLGASDAATSRAVLRRTVTWGLGAGAVLGVIAASAAWPLALLFTNDPNVHRAIATTLVVVAVTMPMAGFVFVLDGVLIGAGDGRFLAWVGLVTLALYAPIAVVVRTSAPHGAAGLAWSWLAFAGLFMAARAVTVGIRVRGTAWMRTGV